jgi:MFS family permease
MRSKPAVLVPLIAQASTSFGIGLVVFSLSNNLWLSLLVLPICGAGFMVSLAATNTILQTIVPEGLRGRVMAFYAMSFLGTAPIGSLIAGSVAERLGAPVTIMLGGVCCIASGVWFFLALPQIRAVIRPIYAQKGLLVIPDADTGAKTL